MTDKKAGRSTDGRIRIALQAFNPYTGVAELCRRRGECAPCAASDSAVRIADL